MRAPAKSSILTIMSVSGLLGCSSAPVKPPEYVGKFGGLEYVELTELRSRHIFQSLKRDHLAVIPTKNTENLIPYLNECRQAGDESMESSIAIVTVIAPFVGMAAIEDQKREQLTRGATADMLATRLLGVYRETFARQTIVNTLPEAFKVRPDAIAIVDLSASEDCVEFIPRSVSLKLKVLDGNGAEVCRVDKSIDSTTAYNNSDMNRFFDTSNWEHRMWASYFRLFQQGIIQACGK